MSDASKEAARAQREQARARRAVAEAIAAVDRLPCHISGPDGHTEDQWRLCHTCRARRELHAALDAQQGVPSYGLDDLEQATENGARHVVNELRRCMAVGSLDAFFARDPEDIVRAAVAEPFKPDPAPQGGAVHPCAKCGVMRTEAEGGTTFTVCDECWDAKHGAPQGGGEAVADAWGVFTRAGLCVASYETRAEAEWVAGEMKHEMPYTVAALYAHPLPSPAGVVGAAAVDAIAAWFVKPVGRDDEERDERNVKCRALLAAKRAAKGVAS